MDFFGQVSNGFGLMGKYLGWWIVPIILVVGFYLVLKIFGGKK